MALYTRGGRKRDLNLLVRGAQQLVRTRSRARVLRGLLNYLSADMVSRDPALLEIRTAAVVRDGRATVLPFPVTTWLQDLQPRLNRSGAQLVDAPWVLIDPATAELVVPEPMVEHDGDVLDELDRTDRLGPEPPPLLPGRYPLGSWIIATRPDKEGPLSPGRGLVAAVPVLVVPDGDIGPAAQDLIALFEKVEPIGASPDSPASLIRLLQRAG